MSKIKKIHNNLINKKYSAIELIKNTLKRIKKTNKLLGTYITITEEESIKQAKDIDKKISKGEKLSILSGIPMGIKDNILTKGIRTTCASKMLENYIPIYNATIINKLNKKGAILMGKCNMDEFAMGSTSENSSFFPVKNPWDLKRVAGGSSGGPAATVAAEEVIFSIGTDTGGSIRQPAAFCGVVGLKPTYGSVSRFGIISYASSLDQAGSLTKTIEDCAIITEIIMGYDNLDSTSFKKPVQNLRKSLNNSIKGLKIGVPEEYFKADKEIINKLKEALKLFESLGAVIDYTNIPHAEYALPAYYIIASAEASSNLARFDGIRYGEKIKSNNYDISKIVSKTRSKYFGKEVKKRIMIGTYVLSSGYYDKYYLKAMKIRNLLKKEFTTAFNKFDILLTPITSSFPYLLEESYLNPISMYLGDLCTSSVNLTGIPGLSIPCGFSKELPVGMQLLGKPFSEKLLLNVGSMYEKITKFYNKIPNIKEII